MVQTGMDDAMVEPATTNQPSRHLSIGLLAASVLCVAALAWQGWERGSFVALWFTADQQAQRSYNKLDFEQAYERFEDPAWKGMAAYDLGLYLEAAATFGRLPSAEGFYNRGNAFLKGREYAKAIVSYKQAVIEVPDWREAQDNLELALYTLEYIEQAREESGTDGQLGADDLVYDNTSERGDEMEVTDQSTVELESAEKWMRGVDTDTSEFLRVRFLLEANRRASPQ
jgi:Ca-activated chloride channel family protein